MNLIEHFFGPDPSITDVDDFVFQAEGVTFQGNSYTYAVLDLCNCSVTYYNEADAPVLRLRLAVIWEKQQV